MDFDNREFLERLRGLLCELGVAIRTGVLEGRAIHGSDQGALADIAHESVADTIYAIDKFSEAALLNWFEAHWPSEWPVEVIAEGLEDRAPVVFPSGATPLLACIIDPIDGTRPIMYDKRSAWALAAIGPHRDGAARLADLKVAVMTELPVTKQHLADQISGVRGAGPKGVRAERLDVTRPDQGAGEVQLRPSQARDFRHGFASAIKFFPEAKALTARLEERLWDRLGVMGRDRAPVVFDDQYLSTGGQLYELISGHDRMIADLRPILLPAAGFVDSLACHPYDICTALIAEEVGCIIENPASQSNLDAPLDTTTAVCWIGYSNVELANSVRPILQGLLREASERSSVD